MASLNHFTVPCSAMVLGVPLFVNRFYAGEIRRYCERLLAVEARTAHVRFGLTYLFIVRGEGEISKRKWRAGSGSSRPGYFETHAVKYNQGFGAGQALYYGRFNCFVALAGPPHHEQHCEKSRGVASVTDRRIID
ncbi:hypothetical protein SBA2_40070 [Acidobacteriia bacterium SbA2]|nr:hypothetical protein SBA2_40070 [Acidobacteriia bacterium SbA2]